MSPETIKLIESFEGVIGAVLGVAVTLILTFVLKNSGKLTIFPTENIIHYYNQDTYGQNKDCKIEIAKFTSFDIVLDFYNGSEVPKVFRNLKIAFYKDKTLLHEDVLEDKTSERSTAYGRTMEEFTVLNFQPKTMTQVSMHYGTYGEITDKIKSYNAFKITMSNQRNKRKTVFVYKK
ncbi:hypothetical protein MO973_19950 [Paenibacillus sp. TRM 82003]|nr:hypothetical protein [Paenibacillus sp. TRM 82003]